MSGHAVKTELKGHANGKSAKDNTRLSAPKQFRLSCHWLRWVRNGFYTEGNSTGLGLDKSGLGGLLDIKAERWDKHLDMEFREIRTGGRGTAHMWSNQKTSWYLKKKKKERKYREEKLTQRLSSGYSACKGQMMKRNQRRLSRNSQCNRRKFRVEYVVPKTNWRKCL